MVTLLLGHIGMTNVQFMKEVLAIYTICVPTC